MTDVTHILCAIEQGDPQAAEQLLPLVYDELRRLAAQRLAQEKPGQTLQATALVHEAFVRLVGTEDPGWNGRGHFFAAAAEAMRRILVENARRKRSERRGGGRERVELFENDGISAPQNDELLDIDAALTKLEAVDPDGNTYKQDLSMGRRGGFGEIRYPQVKLRERIKTKLNVVIQNVPRKVNESELIELFMQG